MTTATRLADLVGRLGGELIGDPELPISGIAPLDSAAAMHITFLANPKLRAQAAQSAAGALILSAADHAQLTQYGGARILSDNPYAYYARAAQYFLARDSEPRPPGIHPSAVIDASAEVSPLAWIGPGVSIDARAVIGAGCVISAGCRIGRAAVIGADTVLHPNVSFLDGCRIGERGVIQAGAVIGSDGFGFASERGQWIKIPQTGAVRIGDDVEIGANTTIDRGALEDTVIEEGVKLDNQIQIAHNCVIGAHTAMAGCVGVAGSARIGRHCTFGGAAMVLGHLTIVDHVHVSSGSLVSRSIQEPGQYTGFYPLAKNAEWEKTAAVVKQLDGMRDRVRELERQLKLLISERKAGT